MKIVNTRKIYLIFLLVDNATSILFRYFLTSPHNERIYTNTIAPINGRRDDNTIYFLCTKKIKKIVSRRLVYVGIWIWISGKFIIILWKPHNLKIQCKNEEKYVVFEKKNRRVGKILPFCTRIAEPTFNHIPIICIRIRKEYFHIRVHI